uniref:uncharacterized protein LOC122608260 n=1 Tax=Erigeron canadensis TaxID=72917 RepID=UPI001CB8EF0C|nr:uncharacterized protein LOC122608260 [Erigeron canadensis]
MTRNARDICISISEGGRDNSPFRVMNMEEFTLTKHALPMHTYDRIIYDETLVSPNPPYGDMVGLSNDAEATVEACKSADQAVNSFPTDRSSGLIRQIHEYIKPE